MKNLLKLCAIVSVFWVGPAVAGGDDIAVIVHKSNSVSALSQSDLRPIFQTMKTSWPDGSRISVFSLPESDGVRKGFDAAVLGLDPDRVARYWIDRKIRGGNPPPKSVPSGGAMVKIVSAKTDAVGFASVKDVGPNVKVVAKIRGGQVVAP